MKRCILLAAIALMVGIAASAAYKIQLINGKVITADAKPVVNNGFAYFFKQGLYLYIPATEIDTAKSETLNAGGGEAAKVSEELKRPAKKTAPKAKPVVIDDEALAIIRKRSRLANEGQLTAPPVAGPSEKEEGMQAPAPPVQPSPGVGNDTRHLQSRLTNLLSQRAMAQQRRNSLRDRLSQLRDQFNFSAMQSEKERLQGEIDSAQAQLASAENDLSSLNGQIQSLQQEISRKPVVVERPASPNL